MVRKDPRDRIGTALLYIGVIGTSATLWLWALTDVGIHVVIGALIGWAILLTIGYSLRR